MSAPLLRPLESRPLSHATFERISWSLKQLTGIHLPLNSKNLALVSSRLQAVLRRRGLDSFEAYLEALAGREPGLVCEFVSALTTTTTHFFREPDHFEILGRALPELLSRRRRASEELRVWCSASSRGHEPYSIAMTLLEAWPGARPHFRLLATDINRACLEHAVRGVYSAREASGLPGWARRKYVERAEAGAGESALRVAEHVRARIRFAGFNLTTATYPFRNPFDVVFCRNVLIYFDEPTTVEVIARITRALAPGGLLFLAHCEAAMGREARLSGELVPVATGVFRKKDK